MSRQDKVVLGGLAGAVLCAVLLAFLLPVFALFSAVLLVVVVAAAWWRWGRAAPSSRTNATHAVFTPPTPALYDGGVLDDLLPTQLSGFHFRLSARVSYRVLPGSRHRDPATAARCTVRERAGFASRDLLPTETVKAQDLLADELGRDMHDDTRGVVASAFEVKVDLADDLDRARDQLILEKTRRDRDRRRQDERDLRSYFSEDVLSSTGTALVWWLARQDIRRGDLRAEEIVEAVGLVNQLHTLSAVAQNRSVAPQPDVERPLSEGAGTDDIRMTVKFLDSIFPPDVDPDERLMFIDVLAGRADDFGLSDYARRLRAEFGVTDGAGPDGAEGGAETGGSYPNQERGPDDPRDSVVDHHSEDPEADEPGPNEQDPDDPEPDGPNAPAPVLR